MGRPAPRELSTRSGPGRPLLRVLPTSTLPHAPAPIFLPRVADAPGPIAGAALLVAGAGIIAARVALRRRGARRAGEAARNRAFAELLTTVRERDDALSRATHDLRTPLTTLKGQAQLLQRFLRAVDGPDAERLRAGLLAIDAAATAAAVRIDRLADESERRRPDDG